MVEFLPLLAVLLIPASVHAGVFSSFVSFWNEEVTQELPIETVDYSAQYTQLLSATGNPEQYKAIGGGTVTTANGTLVATGPIGADEIATANTGTGEISVYVVREGDALSQIAEMYGVTTNTILWANDLTSASSIQPGDTLVILPIVGVRHKVAKGETLGSILKKYDADLQEVLDYNNLPSADALSIGDELIIPGGEIVAPQKSRRLASAVPTKSSGTKVSGSFLSHPAPGSIKTQGIHGYNAVDLGSPGGIPIPVLAAASGEVIVSKASGWNGGYGSYVVIKHSNGTQTLYSHLSKDYVTLGQYVTQGQQIGMTGNTGKSTGVHLHFEVRGGRNPF